MTSKKCSSEGEAREAALPPTSAPEQGATLGGGPLGSPEARPAHPEGSAGKTDKQHASAAPPAAGAVPALGAGDPVPLTTGAAVGPEAGNSGNISSTFPKRTCSSAAPSSLSASPKTFNRTSPATDLIIPSSCRSPPSTAASASSDPVANMPSDRTMHRHTASSLSTFSRRRNTPTVSSSPSAPTSARWKAANCRTSSSRSWQTAETSAFTATAVPGTATRRRASIAFKRTMGSSASVTRLANSFTTTSRSSRA
mmetsp:Transcript_73518/g.227050  ORF Transcript_73518/g.227050 Transcript_73518/m.227050 type:complete len:254 (-) Transcript_73518:304-1065(-)